MNIELAVDLDLKEYAGAGITKYDSGLTNAIVRIVNNKPEITQRPSIDISEDSDGIGALNSRARGIYYWEENAKIYIVHDNDVYETTQDSTRIAENSGTFSTGTERCTILETIGTPKLIIIDSENNKLWVMTAAKVLDQVTTNVPSTIVHGGAVMNTHLFIMDETGTIFNSDADAPQTFGALSFVEAERDADQGVYLGKQRDHIVAFGTRTIEFFYYKGGTTNVITRRPDMMHNLGCADGLGVWENGDAIYFLGSNTTGEIGVYEMTDFTPRPISFGSLNSYLTQGITTESLRAVMSGFSAQGRTFVILHIYTLLGTSPGTITPQQTIMYDTGSKKWSFVKTAANGHTLLPVVAVAKRTGGQNATEIARSVEGIMYNGDIFTVTDNDIPVDSLLGSDGILESDIVEVGVLSAGASDVGSNIATIIRTGMQDFGHRGQKFQNFEYLEMENTDTSQTLTVKHADEGVDNFGSGETIDLSDTRKEIYAGGSFVRRNYQLEYSGSEQLFIEGFGVDADGGN